jgi:hypothetical protein
MNEYKIWQVHNDIDLRTVKWSKETIEELAKGLPKGFRIVFFNVDQKKRRDIVNLGRTLAVECFKTGNHEVSEEVVDDYVQTGTTDIKVKKHQKESAAALEAKKLKRDKRERMLREQHLQSHTKKKRRSA